MMRSIGPFRSLVLLTCLCLTGVDSFSAKTAFTHQHIQSTRIHSSYRFQSPLRRISPRDQSKLTTKENDSDDSIKQNPFQRAAAKFRARPGTYLLIPCVAALVGWFTNYLAVQMIFYPIKFRGIPIYIKNEVPLGFLGWQGIVPCKTRPMSDAMVDMVTTQLLSVKEVFGRLNPRKMAKLLAPEVPKMAQEIVNDLAPLKFLQSLPEMIFAGLPKESKSIISHFNLDFLTNLCSSMQTNVESIFNIRNCVVSQMMQDRAKLGELFRACGQAELDFLTNSGLWFGFLLGLIQMAVALFWDNPWSLSIGGGIVGLATNWLALKWIFEPVNPTKIGPFVLQGQFLRRQKEVAKEFSHFFATRILRSEQVWNSILTDPSTTPAFAKLFGAHFEKFLNQVTTGLGFMLEPEVVGLATKEAISKLPQHVYVLYDYIDNTLNLEESLRISMEKMSSVQFERVLHPIFEEDELTLILAGAALGFAAGLIQQGLETGQIKIPDLKTIKGAIVSIPKRMKHFYKSMRQWIGKRIRRKREDDTASSSTDEEPTT